MADILKFVKTTAFNVKEPGIWWNARYVLLKPYKFSGASGRYQSRLVNWLKDNNKPDVFEDYDVEINQLLFIKGKSITIPADECSVACIIGYCVEMEHLHDGVVLCEAENKVLINGIEGPDEIFLGAVFDGTLKFSEEPASGSFNEIKWRIWRLHDSKEDKLWLESRGKEISVKTYPNWAGEQIRLDVYFNNQLKTSKTIPIIIWNLPRHLAESPRIEGRQEDKNMIARDMHFGCIRPNNTLPTDPFFRHTGGHTEIDQVFESIRTVAAGENVEAVIEAIKKDMEESDEELFNRFHILVFVTSLVSSTMRSHNLALMDKMKGLKVSQIPATETILAEYQQEDGKYRHKEQRLTDAVFTNEKTLKFIESIKESFVAKIKDAHGNANEVEFDEMEQRSLFNKQPKYDAKGDFLTGLTVAINDTWGFRLTLREYEFTETAEKREKHYNAQLLIRIFDHFGLDAGDIGTFGTMEQVKKQFPDAIKELAESPIPIPVILSPSLPPVPGLSPQAVFGVAAEILARGFRAWFILQHFRGYRPFITIMEKTEPVEGLL